jgi:ferric-dicitrate binding protein FerR (iron transport regulator)
VVKKYFPSGELNSSFTVFSIIIAMDYSVYDTADFVCNDSFIAWVKHGEQADFWKTVEEQYPEKRTAMLQARAIITAASSLPAFILKEEANAQIWNSIKKETTTPVIRWYWAAAAVGIVTLATLWWLMPQRQQKKEFTYRQLLQKAKQDHPVEVVNEDKKPMAVSLPDGSSVLLQPGARLSYPACFGHGCHRKVYLSGAAFFEIYRDAKQPFIVYANEMIIDVLGTSFAVKAYEEDSLVELLVKTGRVAVSVQSQDKQVILTANQQAILTRSTLLVDVTSMPEHKPLAATLETYSFVFMDAPVDSVMNTIEQAYGVHITYDKALLADCRLTASLYDEPLYEKIRLICKALEASCIIEGNDIKISAKGCHQNVIEN